MPGTSLIEIFSGLTHLGQSLKSKEIDQTISVVSRFYCVENIKLLWLRFFGWQKTKCWKRKKSTVQRHNI